MSEPDDPWHAALRALVQKNNGKPLAALLRKAELDLGTGTQSIPFQAVSTLAELLDPLLPRTPFAKPVPWRDDEIEIVDGKRKLKVDIELVRADKAAMVARARLIRAAKRSRDRLEQDPASLKAYAEEIRDSEALRAYADLGKAWTKWRKARERSYSAVGLSIKPIPKRKIMLPLRNTEIVCEVLMATERGLTDAKAKAEVGDKYGLTDKIIGDILKKASPILWPPKR